MFVRVLGAVLACCVAAGCQTVGPPNGVNVPVVRTETPSSELGRGQFASGNFALAERNFREAVETNPEDYEAWVGLAASYDHLGRFDLADRAYNEAIRIGGETIEVLNNLGYSFLLRGDRVRARLQFERALLLDPTNTVIANNIRLSSGPIPSRGVRVR